jgi:arginase family enzyme
MGGDATAQVGGNVTTSAVFFPFDLFGSGGTRHGALLLADAFREMLADNRREKASSRARSYTGQVRMREFDFATMEAYRGWRQRGRQAAAAALGRGDFLLWVTGNHLGALPVYEELASSHRDALVVQIDAHLDIQNFDDCTKELSHGNFLLHCDPRPAIVNLGHRDLLLPAEHVGRYYRQAISAERLITQSDASLRYLREETSSAGHVLIDLDLDALDPSCFPAVTHPLPFGITPALLLRIIDACWSDRLAGVVLSEFDPGRDRQDQSLSLAAWLMEYLLLRRYSG